ncbi:helix-turn-helix domain-containing protein, partial [Yersinia enterocolitica]
PPNIEGSIVKGLMVDLSNIEGLTVDESQPNNPPMVDPDPSLTSKQDPSNTKTIGQSPTATDPQPVDSLKIDYSAVLEAYHTTLPEMPGVLDMTKDRQTKLRALWKKYDLNLEKWSAYLRYISKKCRWMLEDRPDTSSGKTWRRKNFDYLITEKCYLAVKEVRADDLPKVPKMDTVTRQEAFDRLILRHGKAQNTVEKTALSMAGGLGRMNETSARIEWNGIWAKALDQVSENELRRLAS